MVGIVVVCQARITTNNHDLSKQLGAWIQDSRGYANMPADLES